MRACHVTYDGEPFDLGRGITLRSTYAHLFAASMMAFARASEGKPHPAPWRAARGGYGYDIEAELAVPTGGELPVGRGGATVPYASPGHPVPSRTGDCHARPPLSAAFVTVGDRADQYAYPGCLPVYFSRSTSTS